MGLRLCEIQGATAPHGRGDFISPLKKNSILFLLKISWIASVHIRIAKNISKPGGKDIMLVKTMAKGYVNLRGYSNFIVYHKKEGFAVVAEHYISVASI